MQCACAVESDTKNSLTRNPHFTAAGLRSAQSPGQQKVEPHRPAALDWRADFWQHARQVRCGGVRRKVRGPGSNPRPLRLLPPLLLLTSGVRVEAAASTRSCFSNPRDPVYLSNPGSLALEPTAQRIRRLTGPRRQSLRRLGLEPVILPHLARARRGARASTTAPRPRTDATCRRQTLPFPAPFTHSAAVTSTPPPFPPPLLLLPPLPLLRLLPPTARVYRPKIPNLRNPPRSCSQACRPFDCGSNPSCPRRCDSNPPAHARVSA